MRIGTVEVRRSERAQRMRLVVAPGGGAILTAPIFESADAIDCFLAQHRGWLEKSRRKMAGLVRLPIFRRASFMMYKEATREFLEERVVHWNRVFRFEYGKISVRNTRWTWGSCSHNGNLNFSHALLFVPPLIVDYVVVHELCHLRERNHGSAFWRLVGSALPDYPLRRRELRRYVR